MRINFFKQRTNRRFNYTPRYYKGKKDENPYDFDSTFSKYRDITNSNDFGAHWQAARQQSRNRSNRGFSRLFFIILVSLILIALYILDFDLSIFKN
ncbi:MAG: hypothetical protein VYB41_00380 [Bacteroidota bacterium]|nr:hypothetical protein [Bacteroidota bacterium]